jgi:NADPH-dependent 2,4-dienoyl-CoA reductase/sulfur reductase-like enzyme
MRFVIVGGDAAGMSAASRAKRLNPALSVTVLEQSQDVSYSACNMPYNIADPTRDMEDLVVRPVHVFREQAGIDVKTGHRAERIDLEKQNIIGRTQDAKEFDMGYDRLLIATGASPIIPELPGIGLPGVMVLKSLADGRAIKSYIRTHNVKKALIIGMGYIALEMCEALRARGIDIEMIKPRPDLLPWLARELAVPIQRTLEANHVRLHMGKTIDRIEHSGLKCHILGKHLNIRGDMVLVAVGVRPNSELAATAGLELGSAGAIAVDGQMRSTRDNIYAAGDCADAFHVVSGQRAWIPLALRANRAGWAVADHLCGRPVDLPGITGTSVFKVFDMQVARTGLTVSQAHAAGFQPQSVTIKTHSRSHLYPGGSELKVHMVGDSATGRLLGVQMVGRESAAHRINAAAVALHANMTVPQLMQCDLAYAPPFGGVWDPLLIAANQLTKKLN